MKTESGMQSHAGTMGIDGPTVHPRPGAGMRATRLTAAAASTVLLATAVGASEPSTMPACAEDGPAWPALPRAAIGRSDSARHLDTMYLPAYRPATGRPWRGNLYRFRLREGAPVTADGQPPLDGGSGALRAGVAGEWPASTADDALAGGAASRLPAYGQRQLYTAFAPGPLSAPENRVHPDNPALTALLAGLDADERRLGIERALGRDVDDTDGDGDVEESRQWIGAAVESPPVPQVDDDGRSGVVYLATREGLLHAFDAETGVELWAYAPASLLPGLLTGDDAAERFGLDAPLRLHRLRSLDGAEDRFILLVAMGRGGDRVHALEVTNPLAPALLWEIHPGLQDFADLGETWSTPVVATASWNGQVRSTAFFGGGHDPAQEQPGFREDRRGNAIYAVDVVTGQRLWSAGPAGARTAHTLRVPEMRHAIPAPLRVLDTDGDGLADRIYTGDTGGRLWRLDLPADASPAGAAGVLASLGGAAGAPMPAATDLRRFYTTPDAVPLLIGGRPLIALNLGSGYRANLSDTTIAEAFYSVRDVHAFMPLHSAGDPPPVPDSELVDVTGQSSPQVPTGAAGWRLRLVQAPGEKVLTPAFSLGHTTYFTSFTPATATECGHTRGTTRLYAVSVRNGAAASVHDEATGDVPGESAAALPLLHGSAPLTSLTQLHASTGLLVCAAAHCVSPGRLGLPAPPLRWRTYWYEADSRAD